jgi:hypothetical protein
MSFVVNMNFGTARQWFWTENKIIHGNQAAWENPGNGFGTNCITWDTVGDCLGFPGDMAFDLTGRSK